jgi:hypothetical protein
MSMLRANVGQCIATPPKGSDGFFTHFNIMRLLQAGRKRTIRLSFFDGEFVVRSIRREISSSNKQPDAQRCRLGSNSGCGAACRLFVLPGPSPWYAL